MTSYPIHVPFDHHSMPSVHPSDVAVGHTQETGVLEVTRRALGIIHLEVGISGSYGGMLVPYFRP